MYDRFEQFCNSEIYLKSLELSESDDSLSSFLDATEKTSALMKSRTCDSDDRNDLIKDAMHGSVLHEDVSGYSFSENIAVTNQEF